MKPQSQRDIHDFCRLQSDRMSKIFNFALIKPQIHTGQPKWVSRLLDAESPREMNYKRFQVKKQISTVSRLMQNGRALDTHCYVELQKH